MSRFDLDLGHRRGDLLLEWRLQTDRTRLGLYGASGRGKTTALELLLGWLRPDRGHARVAGAEAVGYAPQDLLLMPHWTVEENLAAARDAAPASLPDELEERMSSALDLGALLSRPSRALSGGEGRRVALARAVLAAADRGLLVLDEPLSSLDRGRRRLVLGFLLDLLAWRADAPTVVVSHSAVDLSLLCEEVQVLETRDEGGGRCSRFSGPGAPAEVLAEEGGYDNLLAGDVTSVRGDAAGLTLAGGVTLTVPGRDLEEGDRIVLGLRGDDVLVATADPGAVSARNVLEGEVARAVERGAYIALGVEVAPGVVIETHVTEGALRDLDLAPGRRVLLLFKTRSLELLSRAPRRS